QRTQFVADDAVQHPPRLVGVDQLSVNGTRRSEGLFHRLSGDFVKLYAMGVIGIQLQRLHQVPRDGLAFSIRVGGQQDPLRLFCTFSQFIQNFSLAANRNVAGGKVVIHVDAELAFGQIANVADAGLYRVSAAQKLADGPGLGRRFHDHEGSHRHPSLLTFASHYSGTKYRCKPARARPRQSYAVNRPPASRRTRPNSSSHVNAAAASSTGMSMATANSSRDSGPDLWRRANSRPAASPGPRGASAPPASGPAPAWDAGKDVQPRANSTSAAWRTSVAPCRIHSLGPWLPQRCTSPGTAITSRPHSRAKCA